MDSFGRWNSLAYEPPPLTSAPSLLEHSTNEGPYSSFPAGRPYPGQLHGGHGQVVLAAALPNSYCNYYGQTTLFPPGTDPDVVRAFQTVDRDRSGFIDETELQQALCSVHRKFDPRTIRLLVFLFRNPSDPARVGPKEFAALWSCLKQWRGMFERFDRDRSGKIDLGELRDALYSLGYALPRPVLQVLVSRYGDECGRKIELNFDSFVECMTIVKVGDLIGSCLHLPSETEPMSPYLIYWNPKSEFGFVSFRLQGLTEKFKEKDMRYTGSATVSYDAFLSMIIPFLVLYN